MNDQASGQTDPPESPAGYRIFVDQVLGQLQDRLPSAVVYATQFDSVDNTYRVISARGDTSLGIVTGLEIPLDQAFCFLMATDRAPRYSPDAANDPAYASVNPEGAVGTYAGAPIELRDGTRVGSLCVVMTEQAEIDPDSLSLLSVLASSLAHSLEAEREVEVLRVANQKLKSESATDELTGLANRRTLDREIERCWRLAERGSASSRGSAYLVVADIEDFAGFNAAEGHAAGDAVLIELANAISSALPAGGIAGRLSGDSFAAILEGYDNDLEPMAFIERAARLAGPLTRLQTPCVVSFGLSSVGVAESPQAALDAAWDHSRASRPLTS